MNIPSNIQKVIKEINKASLEIPFGNSEFQNLNFVLNAEITPARQLRHCLLRLNDRITALRDSYYSLELEDIDLEEMQEKLEIETNKFEKRRLIVKIEQKKINRISTDKLIKDCLSEIETLYNAFTKLPKYTREQFELEEKQHFELLLTRDAFFAMTSPSAVGQLQSLDAMGNKGELLTECLLTNGESLRKIIDDVRLQTSKLIEGKSCHN